MVKPESSLLSSLRFGRHHFNSLIISYQIWKQMLPTIFVLKMLEDLNLNWKKPSVWLCFEKVLCWTLLTNCCLIIIDRLLWDAWMKLTISLGNCRSSFINRGKKVQHCQNWMTKGIHKCYILSLNVNRGFKFSSVFCCSLWF